MRLLLVLSLVAVAGCGDPEAPATVDVHGVYLGPLYDGEAATIDHEAVGDRMPAMRMDLRVADPAALDALTPGQPARFALDSASLTTIWAAEPLPADTPLDLYDPEADTSAASGIVAPE